MISNVGYLKKIRTTEVEQTRIHILRGRQTLFDYFSCCVSFMFDNSLSNTSNLTREHGICVFIAFNNSQGTPICSPFIESAETPDFKEKKNEHVVLRTKCLRSSPDSCYDGRRLTPRQLKYIHFLTGSVSVHKSFHLYVILLLCAFHEVNGAHFCLTCQVQHSTAGILYSLCPSAKLSLTLQTEA